MKKIASIAIIAVILIITTGMNFNAYAVTTESLQSSLNSIQSAQKTAQSKLDAIMQENKSTSKQIADISTQIASYQNQIADLNDQISNLQTTIQQTTAQLSDAQAQYAKQQQMLEDRLVALYENGNTTYLDVLLNSNSLGDFVSNYYLISEVASYDSDLLSQIEQSKEQLQTTENNLEAQQSGLESRKSTLQGTEKSLSASKASMAAKMSTLTAEQQALQQQIDGYNQQAANVKTQIAALIAKPSIPNSNIVAVAESQLGNVGGAPYWSWYGYSVRVEWCACFVSWCANQCGYIASGNVPMFSYCPTGVNWFKSNGLWQSAGTVPNAGYIIFFCWDGSGVAEHVGIVKSVSNGTVYTIEGNSSNACRENQYPINSSSILGYGT